MTVRTASSRTDPEHSALGEPVDGKVVVITGATSGLGLETATQLAMGGAEVVMISRDRQRGERARSMVEAVAAGTPPVLLLADLSVQADIRRVAGEVKDRYDRVDILINNAGNAFNSRRLSGRGSS